MSARAVFGFLDRCVLRIRRHDLARKAASTILLPIELALSVLLYLLCARALRITAPGRIGHLALEPDIYLKLRKLGMRRWYFGMIISPPGVAANECLLDYWGRHISVVRFPFLSRILARLYRFRHLQYDISRYAVAINETAPYIAVQRAWGTRPALLSLTEKHRREGLARLTDWGLPADAEFVCFHCREGGYSPSDENLHSFRNCGVENYLAAAEELARRGYWCIRMGDPSMRRLAPMERVIDYAHLESRSDWMDVFLCASCKFFLGSASGLSSVAAVFGRACGTANQAPLSTILQFGLDDVAIPKLLWSEREGRHLNFREVLDSDISNFRFTELYRKNGIVPVENTADEVRDLALEMLERSEGRVVYTKDDEELQRRFKGLLRPGHFGYGGINRVGRDFLRKHAHRI
jgi:putative glycosyltransferase (TIGR04372 family)